MPDVAPPHPCLLPCPIYGRVVLTQTWHPSTKEQAGWYETHPGGVTPVTGRVHQCP